MKKNRVKKYFGTGLVILLPLALTLLIVQFLIDLLTTPFVGIVQSIFTHYGIFEKGFLFLTAEQVQILIGRIIILCLLVSLIMAIGMVARWFMFHYFLNLWDAIIKKIPFVKTVYRTSQDIVGTIFVANKGSFKKVVMVPFPHQKSYSIGMVTSEKFPNLINPKNENFVSVFIPTTPNPTSGYVILFKNEDIVHLDMKVEDAFKFIISCGVIEPPLIKEIEEKK